MLEKDGSGKEVYLGFGNIATSKQMPYLIRGMNKIMPNLTYLIRNDNFQRQERDVFFRDLDRNNISSKNFKFISSYPDILKISLSYDNGRIFSFDDNKFISFPIDPLKFSERKILSEDGVGELKEKYKIRDVDHVAVGGSFHFDDFSFLKNHLKKISNTENFRFVVVPRNGASILRRYSKENNISYELDEKVKGNENILFVEEKGILDDLYSICDVALLGNTFGSFSCGQNPLEPAFYGKKMIYGNSSGSRNYEAYKGLRQSGLLKKIKSPNKVVDEMIFRKVNDLDVSKKAFDFMKSWQGFEGVYANIVKKNLYDELSFEDKNFLFSSNSYEAILERFS